MSATPGKEQTFEEKVDSEITNYRKEKTLSLTECPLAWWKLNESYFPLLSRLAKRIMGIPATSVASERVFSTAGDIVTATRSTLRAENVDMLIFIKKNL